MWWCREVSHPVSLKKDGDGEVDRAVGELAAADHEIDSRQEIYHDIGQSGPWFHGFIGEPGQIKTLCLAFLG